MYQTVHYRDADGDWANAGHYARRHERRRAARTVSATPSAPAPSCSRWPTEVFAEDGYSGARVDDIAEQTRTTKRMIYYYFGGKEQLYLAVLENAYLGIREAEQALRVDDLDPIVAVRRLAELTYDHHVSHPEFIRLVSIENIHQGEFIKRLDSAADDGHAGARRCSTRCWTAAGRRGSSATTSTPSTSTW